MKVCVIGAGYVGLVTAACLAEIGNRVICVEKNAGRLESLRQGRCPIYEPGLDELIRRNSGAGRLFFDGGLETGVRSAELVFVCVGTPQGEGGEADLSQVEEAARQIAECAEGYKLIVEKSTVPVNTHLWVKRSLKRYTRGAGEFDVASNPEFLREGTALEDFMKPDRIVVGVESERARRLFEDLYRPFTDKGYELLVTDPAAAELIKHAANSFLAMKISYINMIAELCEKVGADVTEVAHGLGLDRRIGTAFLKAGIGYGGSCFPKDLRAFITIAEEHGLDFSLLRETEKINARTRHRFIDKLESVLWINKNKRIAVWGLAFKADTDDVREAPSLVIVRRLLELGARLALYDPQAMREFEKMIPAGEAVSYAGGQYDCVEGADALIVLTEWKEFAQADLARVKAAMRFPIMVDGRNLYDPASVRAAGFEYYPIGRGRFSKDAVLNG